MSADLLPVVIDLETRSACDLRAEGGHRYAKDATTRLLTVAWTEDLGESFHVWFPGLPSVAEDTRQRVLGGATVHCGPLPMCFLGVLTARTWIGHNCSSFDAPVWAEQMRRAGVEDCVPVDWYDTYPNALSIGLPGGLNAIGELLWGKGKYADGSAALKKHSRCTREPGDCDPRNVQAGIAAQIGAYTIQDVRLTAALYKRIVSEQRTPDFECRVLSAHHAVNNRGVRVDRGLVVALQSLSTESMVHAVEEIKERTRDCPVPLEHEKHLRSRLRMFEWLDAEGVSVGTSLRKDLIARFIENNQDAGTEDYENPESSADDDDDKLLAASKNLARVVKVLELRMQALRITSGKLDVALVSLDPTHRARALFAYWAAHTGRWGGRRIQVQNLPRPKEGVDVWGLLKMYEETGRLDYSTVRESLPIGARGADGKLLYPFLSVDDVSSGLLRSIFIPDEGDTLAAADLSNIEARVLAWLAGEEWLMSAFWDGADPYMIMARKIFGPTESWPQFPDPKKPGQVLPLKKHPYRQVGKVVVLGCGYGLGVGKFAAYAAQSGIDLDAVGTTPAECIYAFRRMHPAIAGVEAGEYDGKPYFRGGLWDKLNAAAVIACTGGRTNVGPVAFYRDGDSMIIELPSGRRLTYRGACLSERDFGIFGRKQLSPSYYSARYKCTKYLYGGAIAENVVQAIARDVLAHGLVSCEDAGLPIVLHVHDELVSSTRPENFGRFMSCMTTCPEWLTDFPLDAEGSCAPRYAKSPPPGVTEDVYRNGRKHK